ncbi:MAG: MBL fold metallo-hydrolase [Candidatus Aenigmatarchaeota archaeon]
MNYNPTMVVKYWGVRGSIPAPLTTEQIQTKEIALILKIYEDGGMENLFGKEPSPKKIKEYLSELPISLSGTYGGDTTSIEVQTKDSPLIVFDAGSGARALGNALLGRIFSGKGLNPLYSDGEPNREIHLFLSHYHWDHIQGFPFFAPGFMANGNRVDIHFYGKRNATTRLSNVLQFQQQYPHFPVEWQAMPCKKSYTELGRKEPVPISIGKAVVTFGELDHPDRVFGYRVEIDGKVFVCGTDTEHRDIVDPTIVQLAKNADILYYDAQYLPEEYSGEKGMSRVRWGHSTYEWAVATALAANTKTVVLGHHDPPRDDFELENMLKRAFEYRDKELSFPKNSGKTLNIVIARQGLEQIL